MEIRSKHTRFRAYQLRSKGSSFSYWDGSRFILGEARYNKDNKNSIWHELKVCGKTSIDVLHITSWDSDHCAAVDLEGILEDLKPNLIECPGHPINTGIQNQVTSHTLINNYLSSNKAIPKTINVVKLDPNYISSLFPAKAWSYNNIIYNNKKDYSEENNNSSIKLFKSGSFSVLSLGDLEKDEISQWLSKFNIIQNEVDVLLLSHHGSDNGFTSSYFLNSVKPKVAISLSNWNNQHNHPSPAIISRIRNKKIDYYSTKQGDLIIESIDDHTRKFKVWNFIFNGGQLKEEPKTYTTKRGSKESVDKFIYIINNWEK